MNDKKVLVLFSGGQDSTTCLGWAIKQWGKENIEALSIIYGQRHEKEIEQAEIICKNLGVKRVVIKTDILKELNDSNLLNKTEDINKEHNRVKELPSSFVPNRNALFILIAHAYAQKKDIKNIVTGTCETDYSGYPDCRAEFIKAIEVALNLGSLSDTIIHTPLMKLTKAQTFELAKEVGVLDEVINNSMTCYNGSGIKNEWGYGCGECPACKLRKKGWEEYNEIILCL